MAATKKVVLSSSTARSLRSPQGGKKRGVIGGYIDTPHSPPPSNCSTATEKNESVESLLQRAGDLTEADKRSLLAKLSLSLQDSTKDSQRDQEMWSGAIYEALSKAIPAHGYGQLLVRKQVATPAAWAPVRGFMEASGFLSFAVVERQAVYNLLADLLLRYTKQISDRQGMPMTLKLIASCSTHVGAAFEHEFPGYLASGLGKVIVRQMLKPPEQR